MTTAEKYVTSAYLVVLAVVLLYVVIYAFKIARLEREVADLAGLAGEQDGQRTATATSPRARSTRLTRQ